MTNSAWFETVAEAQRRAKKRLPKSVYAALVAGSERGITIDIANTTTTANITIATQMEMRPNDVVFIEEQPITKWNRALSQFFPPLISIATSAVRQ